MSNHDHLSALQRLAARFANSFDLKEWGALRDCLAPTLYTDYSDLRGTPPETMSRERFVDLRRSALDKLQTHHLGGNVEIELSGETSGQMKLSMVIYRRDVEGQTLNTHCLYFFGVELADGGWRIHSIRQKVFIRDGVSAIHSGIVRTTPAN